MPAPAARVKKTRKKITSRLVVLLSMTISPPLFLRPRKTRAATPTMNMASVARRNGAPRIAPMPISLAASAALPPSRAAPIRATTGIMVSGRAVPTAASTLPTAPWLRFIRSPSISTALVNSAAAPSIAAREITNCKTVAKAALLDRTPPGPNVLDSTLRSLVKTHRSRKSRNTWRTLEYLEKILDAVARGALSPEDAAKRLKDGEVRYLDEFAVLDMGRAARKGVPEIVYAAGKTPVQVAKICAAILERSERAIVSGPSPEQERILHETLPDIPTRTAGRSLVIGPGEPIPTGGGRVAPR